MQGLFGVIGMLIMFFLWLMAALAPYYVAYNIIEPEGFLGVVGVFFLGSVIVPITLGLVSFILSGFSGSRR